MTHHRPAPSGTGARRGHRLGRALVDIPLLALRGVLGTAGRPGDDALPLGAALPGDRLDLASPAGRVSVYRAGPPDGAQPPLLLVHSVNAAASAYEVRPIYERAAATRQVYALELPGYGFSERADRLYTPRTMTDAILATVDEIARQTGGGPVDALALSLSSEFLARAAVERPTGFRSLALVTPTGLDGRKPRNGPPDGTRGRPAMYKAVTARLWRGALFRLLSSRVSIRYFLEKTWGSKAVDDGLLAYDYVTTHQPGAEHAPFAFISGYLFANDVRALYAALELPVWVAHGVRGDFTDYRGKTRIEGRPNWAVDVFDTGALPHFEVPDEFQGRYAAFLARLPGRRA